MTDSAEFLYISKYITIFVVLTKKIMLHRGDLCTVKKGAFCVGMASPKMGEPYMFYRIYVDKGNQIAILQ